MEEGDRCPDGPTTHGLVLEGHAEVLAIKRKRNLTLVHVEVDSKNTLLFEGLAVLATLSIATVSQLAKAIKSESEIVVAEGVAHTELLLRRDPDFEFVLRARVSYNLPVVLPVHERSV